ncbi:MAG: pyrimidine-nucleoside phosphorylase [Hornefia sp.]|nr:pyrimidine-nucleoside phosphorylase [Hornefia sp.]
MNMEEIIRIKREGGVLTPSELKYFVRGYVAGEIPDYQVSALLMAIYFQKLTDTETAELTNLMRYSGDTVDLREIPGVKVDKHSTGGVGDKTTLIAAPIAASAGIPVAKMSGRGLGFTGGTIDKLQSIPGFRTALSPAEFIEQVKNIGISIIGQSGNLTPADKKLYALRDVTATVDDKSLIAASIMSKKLAAGSDAVVLDVKCGKGAFMKTLEDARTLSRLMVDIGAYAGKKTIAVISDMNQPLGCAVGNALEVREAVEILKGRGPSDIRELSIKLAGIMIYAGKAAASIDEGCEMAESAILSGAALDKFRELIKAQGGMPEVCDDTDLLALSDKQIEVHSEFEGYVNEIDGEKVGLASQHTGAGRVTKDDEVDHGAGILLNKKVGDFVRRGELLATVFSSDLDKAESAEREVIKSYRIGDGKAGEMMLIKDII